MRALACLLVIACSSSPKPPPPQHSTPKAPEGMGGAVTFTQWSVSHVDSLFFTDDGERLIAVGYGSIVEIDTLARKLLGGV